MAGLPEWKVQLLERKRREEEDARRREKEQQERLANMPAWKREIIERRRAKLGSGASFSDSSGNSETIPGAGGAIQSPSSCQLHSLAGVTGSPVWLEPSLGSADDGSVNAETEESAVLQENIGPIHQNPFIKLEKQRKESSELESGSRVRQKADLYSQLPGVRTIRAENIIIIESDPQYFSKQEKRDEVKAKSVEALNNLISHHGRGVTEIRASEVVIIKSSLSRSVEDLNTLNKEEGYRGEVASREGRVSKLLSRFGHEKDYDRRMKPMRSRSTENIMEKALHSALEEPFHNKAFTRENLQTCSGSEEHIQYPGSKYDHEEQTVMTIDTGRVSPLPISLPVRPSSPSDHTFSEHFSPQPQPDGERANGHRPFSGDYLPPPQTVASFRTQFEARSSENPPHEVQRVESPKRSLSYPSMVMAKPWMKESLPSFEESGPQHVEDPLKTSAWPAHSNKEPVLPSSAANLAFSSDARKARGNILLQNENSQECFEDQVVKPAEGSASPAEKTDTGLPSFVSKSQLNQDAIVNSQKTVNPSLNISRVSEGNFYGDADVSAFHPTPHEQSGRPTPNLKQAVSASTSTNDSFEIKPAPTPNLSLIAEDDLQAKALANLRIQSKNSFVIIPKRQQAAPPQEDIITQKVAQEVGSLPEPVAISSNSSSQSSPSCASKEFFVFAVRSESSSCTASAASQSTADNVSSGGEQEKVPIQIAQPLLPSPASQERREVSDPTTEAAEDTAAMNRLYNLKPVSVQARPQPSGPEECRLPSFAVRKANNVIRAEKAIAQVQPISVTSAANEECQVEQNTPVTTSDETGLVGKGPRPQPQFRGHVRSGMVVSTSSAPIPEPINKVSHPAMQRKGNTITINPRKVTTPGRPAAAAPAVENGCPSEAMESDSTEKLEVSKAAQLKKRYPTAEEIQVIGGYLSLEKSCLSKNDPNRTKMKISFNESRLETTFEYPSESAMMEEFGPEEEADGPATARPSEEEDDEEVILPVQGIPGSPLVGGAKRIKPLIVDESCRR